MSMPMRWEATIAPQPLVDLPEPQLRTRTRGRRASRSLIAFSAGIFSVLVFLGIFAVGSFVPRTASIPALLAVQDKSIHGLMRLESSSAERKLGFVTVAGSAVNHSNRTLSDVEAVVELLDSRGHTLRIESALASLSVLPKGESTPFQVELPDAPHASAYRIRFRRLLGGMLD